MIETLQLNNYSTRAMPFELSWPADCVSVAPARGVIAPRSITNVRVSVDTDPRARNVPLPLDTRIHVTCGDSHKVFQHLQTKHQTVVSLGAICFMIFLRLDSASDDQ